MDPLAFWWVHPVTVVRRIGEGAYGPIYAEPTTETGLVEDGHRMVRTADGREVVSTARVFLPLEVAAVPVGSLITRSDGVEPAEVTVLATARHHHPAPGMPSHWEVSCQ